MTARNPQPGEVGDPTLGFPGPATPLPEDDHLQDERTEINDEEEDD